MKDNTCDGFPVSNLKPLTPPETPNKETPTIRSSFVQEKLHPGAAMTTEVTRLSLLSFSTVLESKPYRIFFSLNIVVVSHKF